MNRLPIAKRALILQMLVEGNSLRATSRMADVSINTVTKLLVDVAGAAYAYHDAVVRNLHCMRVQCDEIWSFVGAKMKNVPESKAEQWGDVWTWTALDADTKLIVSYLVGQRGPKWANAFMLDVASRINSRVQITTDGHRAYVEAVEGAFGCDVDYAMLVKQYGNDATDTRYSPGECIGCINVIVQGTPDPRAISTSFVERQNLNMRMSMRRFPRLTNAFSKKIENHEAAVALHFLHYNFARIRKTLRITPAMAAGISDHVWSYEEIAALSN